MQQSRGVKRLLAKVHESLVIDWRRRAAAIATVKTAIGDVLDAELPEDPYPPEIFDAKVDAIFDHIVSSYDDNGSSVYDSARTASGAPAPGGNGESASQVAVALLEAAAAGERAELQATEVLLGDLAQFSVAWLPSARVNVAGSRSEAAEGAVVDVVRQRLLGEGGTVLIGVSQAGEVIGLDADFATVQLTNANGFVSWLTIRLISSVGHQVLGLTRIRIEVVNGHEVCRIDVAGANQAVAVP